MVKTKNLELKTKGSGQMIDITGEVALSVASPELKAG